MSSATGVGRSDLSRIFSQAQIDRATREVTQLEEQLSHISDESEAIRLIGQIMQHASHSAAYISPEELLVLEQGIEEIDEIVDPASGENDCKEEAAPGPMTSQRKHSKRGFFAKKCHQVAHAARKVGRGIAQLAGPMQKGVLTQRVSHGRSISEKVKRTAEKVGHFVKKHKKELIIGAIIAAVVIAGVIVIAATGSSAAAAAGGSALVGVCPALNGSAETGSTKPKPKAIAPNSPDALVASNDALVSMDAALDDPMEMVLAQSNSQASAASSNSSFSRVLSPGFVVRQAGFKKAEEHAKESRFPGLVHKVEDVNRMGNAADVAFERFKINLIASVDKSDVKAAVGLAVAIAAIPRAGVAALPAAVYVALEASEVGIKYVERVKTLYAPVGEAYSTHHKMDKENRQASFEKCEAIGYAPRLEFHPDATSSKLDEVIFIDRNNPNAENKVSVIMPEEF